MNCKQRYEVKPLAQANSCPLVQKHRQSIYQPTINRPSYLCIILSLVSLIFFSNIPLMALEEVPFLPTWKLLNTQEKQQFVSGYSKGWKDAAEVIDIAISYVEQNPKRALDGLKSLREVYELGDIRPDSLVREIDAFYSDPDNSKANLSKAVTAAKNRRR